MLYPPAVYLLRHIGNVSADVVNIQLCKWPPIQLDDTAGGLVQLLNESDDSALAAAALAHQGNRLPWLNAEVQAAQHLQCGASKASHAQLISPDESYKTDRQTRTCFRPVCPREDSQLEAVVPQDRRKNGKLVE